MGRPPGEGNSYSLQYSSLKNSMGCVVHGVAKSQTWLSDFHSHSRSEIIIEDWKRSQFNKHLIEYLHVCVCVCTQLCSRAWLFATPCTIAHQAPLSMEFSRQEYWGGLPFPPPGDLFHSGTEPVSSALAGRFFITEPLNLGSPNEYLLCAKYCAKG